MTVHKDDKYCPDASVFAGRPVIITEKLDGGNTALWNGDVYARSTGHPSAAGWMAMVKKYHAWKTLEINQEDPSIVCYGEDMYGIHSIEYDAMRRDETYRLFALRYARDDHDEFASWDVVEKMAKRLMIPTTPVLFSGTFDHKTQITRWFYDHIDKPSVLGGAREGFVIRRHDEFLASDFSINVAKFVRPGHVQTDQHWKVNWQPCKILDTHDA